MSLTPLNTIPTNHVLRVYTINSRGEKVLKSTNQNNNPKIHSSIRMLIDILETMSSRRKCYTFQIFKQFFLFPQEIQTSTISINPYHQIIFDDEALHTMLKIYETKEKERIIWAFLNFKFWKTYKKVVTFTQKINRLTGKIQQNNIKEGFKHIQIYSMMLSPKKSSSNSGLTRVVSNSLISTKKPGHIYQSEVKRIRINANEIYKSRHLEHQKSQDKYKSSNIPQYYQNHYPQSTSYIHYQSPTKPTTHEYYNPPQQHISPHQCMHQCAPTHQYYQYPHHSSRCSTQYIPNQCNHYSSGCPGAIHLHINLPQNNCSNEKKDCYEDNQRSMYAELSPRGVRPNSKSAYHMDDRIDYMNKLQKELLRDNKNLKFSSFTRQSKE